MLIAIMTTIRGECRAMFFPKADVKDYPVRRWHRQWRMPRSSLRSSKPSRRQISWPPDQAGQRLFRQPHRRNRRDKRIRLSQPQHAKAPAFTLLQARPPTDALICERRCRQFDGLWLREPKQVLRADILDRSGDLRALLISASISCTSRDAE
jgi:hypothetical protein